MKGAQARGKGGRRRALTSALDLDQFALSVRALTATCLRLDIRDGETWRPMTGSKGDTLDLELTELLRTFGVMDSASLLRKLFGRRPDHRRRAGVAHRGGLPRRGRR